MTWQIARMGGVFFMALAMASLGLTGSASATSASISNTGPGSVNIISSGSWDQGHKKSCTDWGKWNPHTWRKVTPGSFNEWHSGVTKYMKHCKQTSWPKKDCKAGWTGRSWMPSDDWNSWSPENWQKHCQKPEVWHSNCLRQVNKHYNDWKNDWQKSQQPKVLGLVHSNHSSGDNHSLSASINLTGPGSTNVIKSSFGNGGASISNTGPHSTNIVKSTHGGGSISTTGPGSTNIISGGSWGSKHGGSTTTKDTNNVSVSNTTNQRADSGDAVVKGNTRGGNATSGDAKNVSDVTTSVDIANSSSGGSWWHKTTNTNNVNVTNKVSQTATTGNAVVYGNTYGGNATSGDASNYSSVSTDISIRN